MVRLFHMKTRVSLKCFAELVHNCCAIIGEVCDWCVYVCLQGKEIRLLKDEEKEILKRLRVVMLISGKTQLPLLKKLNAKELKEAVELLNSVMHNVITNSITEMNNLLYAGA